eukprot:8647824-Alexandrium_andersonii.AAC.1
MSRTTFGSPRNSPEVGLSGGNLPSPDPACRSGQRPTGPSGPRRQTALALGSGPGHSPTCPA